MASTFASTLGRILVLIPSAQRIVVLQSLAPLLDLQPTGADVGNKLIVPLIDQTSKAFEHTGSAKKRKVTALLLAALLEGVADVPSGNDELVQAISAQLPVIVPIWSDVLGEVREHSGEAQAPYLKQLASTAELGVGALDEDEDDWLEDTSPGTTRLQQLAEADGLVLQTELAPFLLNALQRAQTAHPALIQAGLNALDPVTLQVLMQDLNPVASA